MHKSSVLHNLLKKSCPNIHSTRLSSLMDGVDALLNGNKLSVAGLGRSSLGKTATKHQIKKMDYLVGNAKLHLERTDIYHALAMRLIPIGSRPEIIVDWSGVSICGKYHMLTASLCAKGRAITIYDEVHKEQDYGKQSVHKKFLSHLAEVIGPKNLPPIIITDAGFRNPWFKTIEAMGWNWVGRVRHNTLLKQANNAPWQHCESLHTNVKSTAKYLGEIILTKANQLQCHMHTIKNKSKQRKHRNLRGHVSRCGQSRKKAKGASEPWLLATSLPPNKYNAKKVISIYRKRMQIEETFRDLKNTRNGFSFSQSRTISCQRFDNLLLISALTSFLLWLIGAWAKEQGLERKFQANTVKNRAVLSVISLAKSVLKKESIPIPIGALRKILMKFNLLLGEMSC